MRSLALVFLASASIAGAQAPVGTPSAPTAPVIKKSGGGELRISGFMINSERSLQFNDAITTKTAQIKGIAVGGAIAVGTILAGFADRGRPLPANVAANKAYGEAFQKSIADGQAENRRRVAEHRTTVRIDQEAR